MRFVSGASHWSYQNMRFGNGASHWSNHDMRFVDGASGHVLCEWCVTLEL